MLLAAGSNRSNFADITVPEWGWPVLIGTISVLLLVDILVFHRRAHVIKLKEAAIESIVWISFGIGFMFVVWWMFRGQADGHKAGIEYISGYLIEKSLSIDNVFVWAMIFTHFQVPRQFQHRVLFWGIMGVLVMRAIMIGLGAALISNFSWVPF